MTVMHRRWVVAFSLFIYRLSQHLVSSSLYPGVPRWLRFQLSTKMPFWSFMFSHLTIISIYPAGLMLCWLRLIYGRGVISERDMYMHRHVKWHICVWVFSFIFLQHRSIVIILLSMSHEHLKLFFYLFSFVTKYNLICLNAALAWSVTK